MSLNDLPFVSGTVHHTNALHTTANAANMKNVSPTPMRSLIVENSLVTRNEMVHEVAPHRLLEIAFVSVVNSSPVSTHGIGLSCEDCVWRKAEADFRRFPNACGVERRAKCAHIPETQRERYDVHAERSDRQPIQLLDQRTVGVMVQQEKVRAQANVAHGHYGGRCDEQKAAAQFVNGQRRNERCAHLHDADDDGGQHRIDRLGRLVEDEAGVEDDRVDAAELGQRHQHHRDHEGSAGGAAPEYRQPAALALLHHLVLDLDFGELVVVVVLVAAQQLQRLFGARDAILHDEIVRRLRHHREQ